MKHDAVVALGRLERHVLVEHVVEHELRVALAADRPSRRHRRSRTGTPAPAACGTPLAMQRIFSARSFSKFVTSSFGAPSLAARDARHRVLHADDVGVTVAGASTCFS